MVCKGICFPMEPESPRGESTARGKPEEWMELAGACWGGEVPESYQEIVAKHRSLRDMPGFKPDSTKPWYCWTDTAAKKIVEEFTEKIESVDKALGEVQGSRKTKKKERKCLMDKRKVLVDNKFYIDAQNLIAGKPQIYHTICAWDIVKTCVSRDRSDSGDSSAPGCGVHFYPSDGEGGDDGDRDPSGPSGTI